MAKLDFDKGMLLKRDMVSKALVGMYLQDPGTYYGANGRQVPEAMALAAGFDVAKFKREKIRRDKLQAFQHDLAAEMELADGGDDYSVVAETGGYRVLRHSSGNVLVVDVEDGSRVNPIPLSEKDGMDLFNRLTSKETEDGSAAS